MDVFQLGGNNGVRRQFHEERHLIRGLRSFEMFNDTIFKHGFRVSRHNFELCLQELGPHLYEGQTKYAITAETKVSIVQLYLLSNCSIPLWLANFINFGEIFVDLSQFFLIY